MQQKSCDNQTVASVNLPKTIYKEFKLKDLFVIENVKQVTIGDSSYTKDDDIIHIDGSVPYISATTTNNGIKGYSQLEPNNEEGCITLSTTADSANTVFYQGEPFIGRQQIAGIRFNKGLKIPQREAMYIMTHIKKCTQGFNYANKLTISKLEELTINLPIKTAEDTEPNWGYMEEFITESEVNYLVKQAIQAQRTIKQIRQII